MSLSESEIYMVISWRLYAGVKAYWLKGFAVSKGNISGSAAGS
jgi:hypothetical protein